MAKRPRTNKVENNMARALDQLAAFEEFRDSIAPALQGLVKKGATPEEIYRTVLSHVAARQATIALTSKKPSEALAAISDILNRSMGKPTERREVKMELANASDEMLDSKLQSLLSDDESESLN